jgi:hypothetical protein
MSIVNYHAAKDSNSNEGIPVPVISFGSRLHEQFPDYFQATFFLAVYKCIHCVQLRGQSNINCKFVGTFYLSVQTKRLIKKKSEGI